MELNDKSYVPVLKWKQAEQDALKGLSDSQKESILPLVEIVLPRPKSSAREASDEQRHEESILIFKQDKAGTLAQEIMACWGISPIFVDFTLLFPNELKAFGLSTLAPSADSLGLNVIPVMNLSDDGSFIQEVVKTHRTYKSDICLRITMADLVDMDNLNTRLRKFMTANKLQPSSVYMLVDLKETVNDFDYQQYAKASQKIEDLENWKGFVLSSGAFPEDMTEYKKDKENVANRNDWLSWQRFRANEDVKRIPTYSDYTIRHPIYKESSQFLNPTATIKYTTEKTWLIIKGQRLKFEQYLAGAKILSGMDDFYGANFSSGDQFIADKSSHFDKCSEDSTLKKKTGNTTQWLSAGVNHHMSVVVDQLSKST